MEGADFTGTALNGHDRMTEKECPNGYLNDGKLTVDFDITEDGKIVDLTGSVR